MLINTLSSKILTSKVAQNRFATVRGLTARALNSIAINATKSEEMAYTFSKATPADLERLTSKKIEDSYKRVTWVNPKDKKIYHILEEGRENNNVQVRILDKDGGFIKNAELKPQTIVVFDNFFSFRGKMTHGEMMETFVRRFNPFANVERLEHKKGLFENIKYGKKLPMCLEEKRFSELADKMDKGKKVDYISVSEVNLIGTERVSHKSGDIQKEYVSQSPYLKEIRPIFERIIGKGTRILEASGNDLQHSKVAVSDRLAIDGVEGVGSLRQGKVAPDSCSRNSIFTQHYERRDFFPRWVRDEDNNIIGMNVTGLSGVDLPVNRKSKSLPARIGGTSYATPIRVAKLSLNDMMEGIL